MNRVHKSQLKDITVHLTELRATIEAIRNEAGEHLSTHEDISTARAIADIKNAISHLQGAI